MSAHPDITLTVTLGPDEALAFAQFLKRAGFSDYRVNAQDTDEAYTMLYAGEHIREALAEQGYAPR